MNLEELKKLKEKAQRQVSLREGNTKYRIVFSMGTSGIAAGAREVMTAMLDETAPTANRPRLRLGFKTPNEVYY